MEIKKVSLPARTVASLTFERVMPNEIPELLSPAFTKIADYLATHAIQLESAPFAAFKDIDITGKIPMNDFTLEIIFPIAGEAPPAQGIEVYTMEPVVLASAVYQGPLSGVTPAYQTLKRWIDQKGYTDRRTAWETYLSGLDAPPAEQMTLINIPLLKRGPQGV